MTQSSQGLVSGVNAGTASILASAGTVSATTTVTVVNPTLVSIAVTPANAVVPKGLTRQFAAVGTYDPPLPGYNIAGNLDHFGFEHRYHVHGEIER